MIQEPYSSIWAQEHPACGDEVDGVVCGAIQRFLEGLSGGCVI
jgi:hypothetical protein